MSEAPEPVRISPFRLVGTLAAAGALAGFALVFVYGATQPRIQQNKAEALKRAIHEVLNDPARYDTLYLKDLKLTKEESDGDRVYLGFDENDRPVGFAIARGEPGFQDVVKVIFGYDAKNKRLLGMRVLESKETPGLGDKIEKSADFVNQFGPDEDKQREGPKAPLEGVRAGTKAKETQIDMITGATISSRAVIRIINHALEKWQDPLEAYLAALEKTEKGK